MLEVIGGVVVLVVCVLVCSWHRRRHKHLPGPTSYPVCGNIFQIDTDHIHQNLTDFSIEYGPIFQIKLFSSKIVTITSASMLEKLFESHPSALYTNDRSANSTSDVFYGRKHMGCANYTKETRFLREFHKSDIQQYFDGRGYFEGAMKDEVKALHLRLIGRPGYDKNPHDDLRIFFQNINSILLVGTIIPEDDPDRDILWEFVDNLFTMVDPSVDGPLKMFPFLRRIPGYYGDVYRQTKAARDKVGRRFFDDQKSTYSPGRLRGLVDICISAQLAEVSRNGSSWFSDEYIKGVIFDTLAAGMTELMKSLRLFILLMCHYAVVQTKVQTEIDYVIGPERFPSGSDRYLMPYTEAVMLEIWRYGSQTPLAIPHLCNHDVTIDDYIIEKGSIVFPNLYGIHHDESIWGDPWEFRPERFLDQYGALLPRDHLYMKNIIPFNIGKRACPGQDFARSRTFIGMTSLLQRMRIEPPETSVLPTADPRHYTKDYPLSQPKFNCRFLSRENIVL